jgi:transmembrane sensor
MSADALSAPTAAEAPAIPAAVTQQAVQWLVRLQASGDAANLRQELQQDLQQWRAAHPDHEKAWQRLESFGRRLQGLPALHAPLAHEVLSNHKKAPCASRRKALKVLALMAAVGGSAWLACRDDLGEAMLADYMADYHTGVGERRMIVLADGTQVVLNAKTSIDVCFDDRQRLLRLICGEILVTTAHNPAHNPAHDPARGRSKETRPFLVETTQGRLRALGTRFSVRHAERRNQVALLQGAVEIDLDRGSARELVEAGQQRRFTQDRIEAAASVNDDVAAWVDGMLVAHEMPLGEFLAELARYRSGVLHCDAAIADLKISGIYPLADTDRVLDMVQRALPVEVRRTTRYWVRVVARTS